MGQALPGLHTFLLVSETGNEEAGNDPSVDGDERGIPIHTGWHAQQRVDKGQNTTKSMNPIKGYFSRERLPFN